MLGGPAFLFGRLPQFPPVNGAATAPSSTAVEVVRLGEEHIFPRCRQVLQAVDLVHERDSFIRLAGAVVYSMSGSVIIATRSSAEFFVSLVSLR